MQQTNCHPFRHGKLAVDAQRARSATSATVKRDLAARGRPDRCFPTIEGSTDSEVLFYLALTFGLARRPAGGGRAGGRVRRGTAGAAHGVEHPIQMTIATTDGETVWAFRYSSEGKSRSLFYQHATSRRCGTSTRTTRCSTGSPTTPAWWSPSRWGTCRAHGVSWTDALEFSWIISMTCRSRLLRLLECGTMTLPLMLNFKQRLDLLSMDLHSLPRLPELAWVNS